jgi:transketolase
MAKTNSIEKLQRIAFDIRKNVIKSLSLAGSGHLGGSLGVADIFSVLYFNRMKHNPQDPDWEQRDRFVLSAGHLAPVLYATLAQCKYFEMDELQLLRQFGSRLQGHPGKEHGLPGIEISSGSLGQGLSVAVGMALAAKMDLKNIDVFVLMGDGELQEGSVWEAAMSASFHKLSNIYAIVDRNRKQIDGDTEDVMALEPLAEKWKSFGWECVQCNGNNIPSILHAFDIVKGRREKPVIIIANTIMGKGVKSIENDHRWHGKVPSSEEEILFLNELENEYKGD